MSRSFTISDLSREFEVTPRTIRHYEEIGLLTPKREGQHRIYGQRDRTRLKLILRGRRVGFSLAEIREILGLYDQSEGEGGQLAFLLTKIEARRSALRARRADIDATLAELQTLALRCRERLEQLDGEAPLETAGGPKEDLRP